MYYSTIYILYGNWCSVPLYMNGKPQFPLIVSLFDNLHGENNKRKRGINVFMGFEIGSTDLGDIVTSI